MFANILLFQNNSRIILIKIATYYSQNYAGILGSGLDTYTKICFPKPPLKLSIFALDADSVV